MLTICVGGKEITRRKGVVLEAGLSISIKEGYVTKEGKALFLTNSVKESLSTYIPLGNAIERVDIFSLIFPKR